MRLDSLLLDFLLYFSFFYTYFFFFFFLTTSFDFQLYSFQPIWSYFSYGKITPPNLLITTFLNYVQILMLWVSLVIYCGIVMYKKVIGFKLGFFFKKQNFGSLRLNILVLEEYAYAY